MAEFFRGWKRKAGVVTLMFACLFAAGWFRSIRSVDLIDLVRDEKTACLVHSVDQSLLVIWLHDNVHPFVSTFGTKPIDSAELRVIEKLRQQGWTFFGFSIGDAKNNPDDPKTNIAFCIVPYSLIVIPLTLVSACLLLTRPKRKTAGDTST